MHPEQKKIYQAMTPDQKINIALRRYYSAWELKASGLRMHFPDLKEDEINKRVREIFLYAGT